MTRQVLVLWDIDRTLVYAGDIDQRVYREVFADLVGRVPRNLPVRGTGVTTPVVVRRLFAENGVADGRIEGLTCCRALAATLPSRLRDRSRGGKVMPGAVAALRRYTTTRDSCRRW